MTTDEKLDLDLLTRYADKHAERLGYKKQTEDAKVEEDALEEQVIDELNAHGGFKQSDHKGRTISLRTDTFCSAKTDEAEVNTVLASLDMHDMIKASANKRTLAAWLREEKQQERAWPEELVAVLKITEKQKVGVTNG